MADGGMSQLTTIFNDVIHNSRMPDDCRESILTPINKDQGDNMNCSNYRGIKMLTYAMKLCERIIDKTLRDILSISDGQLGFKPGVETTHAIFVAGTLCDKYSERDRERERDR